MVVEIRRAQQAAIQVSNLEKYYGKEHALKGISFEVQAGEIFTIVGPNGSGKTTTMEIVEGIRTHNAGEIAVLGGSPRDRRIKEKIGVQIQDSQPMNNLTPLEAAKLFRSFYGSGLDPLAALDTVNLTEKKTALVRNLSSGEKKRLEIALAIINNPEVVFLDEPTTGLDPNARRMVWEIIRGLKRKNTAVLFTTHYMDEAESVSDRVAILYRGSIVALDAPERLIANSGLQNRISFSCKMHMQKLIHALEKKFSRIRANRETIEISSSTVKDDLSAIFAAAESSNIGIADLTVQTPNLEDVFLQTTGSGYPEYQTDGPAGHD